MAISSPSSILFRALSTTEKSSGFTGEGSAYISSMSLKKCGESFFMSDATDTETFCVNSADSTG